MGKASARRRILYRRVVRLEATPVAVARGMALGVIFGAVMPPGTQLFAGIPVGVLLGGNIIALIAGTFISNPFTYVPLYVFNCRVGQLFLNTFGAGIRLEGHLRAAVEAVYRWEIGEFINIFPELAWCWVAGGLIVGLACCVPAYYGAYLFTVEAARLRDFARARWAAAEEAAAAKRDEEPRRPEKREEPEEEPPA